MNLRTILGRILPKNRKRSTLKTIVATAMIATLVITTAAAVSIPIYKVYSDDAGRVQSATADTTLNTDNAFFNAALLGGANGNGQSCATCHQPFDGFTISVDSIQQAFATFGTKDPLFRINDTADNPNITQAQANADPAKAFSLLLNLGVVRIGKTLPATRDFEVEFLGDSAQFGTLPNPNDPQQQGAPAGTMTLSVFRRPLVNTNVHFDSAVLWDGRASITNMPGQVSGAIKTLLLGPGTNTAANQDVANFMTRVFTDQVTDTFARPSGAGNLAANGAVGGVNNLLALASDPLAPCLFSSVTSSPPSAPTITGTLTPFSPSTCTPSLGLNTSLPNGQPTSTIFRAWLNLQPNNAINQARLQIARGEEVFNSHPCVRCHRANELGNNPDPTFFPRIGTDSIDILQGLIDGTFNPAFPKHPELQPLLDRVKLLPVYCLRPHSDPTSFEAVPCGSDPLNHPDDVKTTDPGRALVSGKIADVGGFKPPILRDLAVRSPYFHAAAAASIEDLINFYNARFNLNLTQQEKDDLAAFLEAF